MTADVRAVCASESHPYFGDVLDADGHLVGACFCGERTYPRGNQSWTAAR